MRQLVLQVVESEDAHKDAFNEAGLDAIKTLNDWHIVDLLMHPDHTVAVLVITPTGENPDTITALEGLIRLQLVMLRGKQS